MKNLPYLKIIIFFILGFLLGFLIPNIPYVKDKLGKTNDELTKNILKRDEENIHLNDSIKSLESKKQNLENDIIKKDNDITKLNYKIDSVNYLIRNSDTILIKIKKEGYEEINSVNYWNTAERVRFFTEYFKTQNP